MQKVMKFVESYIQWLALGLGLLWVLWVGYAYWVSPPTFTTIGQTKYGPSEVDEFVNRDQGPIDKLTKGVKSEVKVPQELVEHFSKTPRYVETLKEKMILDDFTPPVLASMWPAGRKVVGSKIDVKPADTKPVTLVELTPGMLEFKGVTQGLSIVNKADPKAVINPADLTQKVFQDPNDPLAKPVAMKAADVSWITASAKVDMKKVAEAFAKSGIPAEASRTQFLRVELIRQEMQLDGKWGPETTVAELGNQTRMAWPPKSDSPQEGLYLDYATKAAADIVQPAFYEILRGDVWGTKTMLAANLDPNGLGGKPAEFDPSTVKDISKLTPEEKKLWQAWRIQKTKDDEEARKAEAESRKSRQTPARSPSRGATRGGGGPSSAPPLPTDQRMSPRRSRTYIPPGGRMDRRGPVMTNGVTNLNNPVNAGEIPAGLFDPAAAVDTEIWAHDESTRPGHTYQYKLRLSLKNPLFATLGMAKDTADEKKLSISVDSAFSEPVISPRKQYFFAMTGGDALGGNNPKMKFEYFFWDDGDWKTKTLSLQPGDAVGTTPWTLVDLRPFGSSSEHRAMLVADTGEVDSRFYKSDLGSPDYKRVKALIKPAISTLTP